MHAHRSHARHSRIAQRRTTLDTLDSMLYDQNNPLLLLLATASSHARTHPSETATTEEADASGGVRVTNPLVERTIGKKRKVYACGVCGQPKVAHVCSRLPTLTSAMQQRRPRPAERTTPTDATGATNAYRAVTIVMRDHLPRAAVLSHTDDCLCVHPDCPACFPVSAVRSGTPTAKRPKHRLGEALGIAMRRATEPPSPELDALAAIRAACADVNRTLADLAMPQGPTGGTDSDATESTGPTGDERSDDE